MSDAEWSILSQAVIDGVAGAEDAARVSAEIAGNPERAREFARLALLHDAVERSWNAGAHGRGVARRQRWLGVARRVALVAAVLAVAAGAAWIAFGTGRSASASEVLARIIEVARSGDRTYLLRAVAGGGKAPATRPNGRPQPSIDGAVLYLRAPGMYVLARVEDDGTETLTGCDGARAWIVPAKGSVRVTRDLRRFAGALPGSQQGIAFIDPHDGLAALADSYEIELVAPSGSVTLAQIIATRRPEARGGPKRVEIAFEPETAVIRAMRLENLPQARGGPRSVEFELVDDAPLEARFFSHESHHSADRKVIVED